MSQMDGEDCFFSFHERTSVMYSSSTSLLLTNVRCCGRCGMTGAVIPLCIADKSEILVMIHLLHPSVSEVEVLHECITVPCSS